jgi:hypothetical protein
MTDKPDTNHAAPAQSGKTAAFAYQPTPEEARARRRRNIAIAIAVGAFTLLFYAITIAKLGVGVVQRPL